MKAKALNYQKDNDEFDNYEIRLEDEEVGYDKMLGKGSEIKYIMQNIATMILYGCMIIGFAVVIVIYL